MPDSPIEPMPGSRATIRAPTLPLHRHDIAQIRCAGGGVFTIGARKCGPGTMIHHADPPDEEDVSTKTGGTLLFVQYQKPTTSSRPIYVGRCNLAGGKPLAEERLDI